MAVESCESNEGENSTKIPICIPGFADDVRSEIRFVMGCNQKYEHFDNISTFAKYLVDKYGAETCHLCPAFHAMVHSTVPEGYEGHFDDFGGTDSIKNFLASLGKKCQRVGGGCDTCQEC